jgi:hypothetical protein
MYIVYLCIIAGGENTNIFSVVVIIKKGENVGPRILKIKVLMITSDAT